MVLSPDIWMKDVGERVRWGPEPILVQKSLPLVPLSEALMEVEASSTMPMQEDGAIAENDTMVE